MVTRLWAIGLAVVLSGGAAAAGGDFTWDNMLLAKMKLDKGFDYESHVDSYMKIFRPAVWKRVHNDEFELGDKRRETIQLMRDRVEAFSLAETFRLNTSLSLGRYDFAKEEFPITQATVDHYWYQSRYSTGDLPSRFSVYFENPRLIRAIPLDRDAAREFIARRKDRYGQVDRQVQATIVFRIKTLKNARDTFNAEIVSATFYDDRGRTRQIHEVKEVKTDSEH